MNNTSFIKNINISNINKDNLDELNELISKNIFLLSDCNIIKRNSVEKNIDTFDDIYFTKKNSSYVEIDIDKLYKYICNKGYELIKGIKIDDIIPLTISNPTLDRFEYNISIINITTLNVETRNVVLEILKENGNIFNSQKYLDLDIYNYIEHLSVNEIASMCIITYLLNDVIKNDFEKKNKNKELLAKILNIPNDKPMVETIIKFLNSRIIINNIDISYFKFEFINISEYINIPMYTTSNIFTYIIKKLKQMLQNKFISEIYNKEVRYESFKCKICGKECNEYILNGYNLNDKNDNNYSKNNSKKRYCNQHREEAINNSKEKSEEKERKKYKEAKDLINKLIKEGKNIPIEILNTFSNIKRKDRCIKICNELIIKLNRINNKNDRT